MPDLFDVAYSNILLTTVAMVLSILIAVYSWHKRKVSGARQLLNLALLGVLWGACYLVEQLVSTSASKSLWDGLQLIPAVFIPPTFLGFVLFFTGRAARLKKVNWVSLFLIPSINALVILTNDRHHLFRQEFATSPDEPVMSAMVYPDYGIWYWLILVFSILLLLIAVTLLVFAYRNAPRWGRGRISGVLAGSILPIVAVIVSIPVWANQSSGNLLLITLIVTIALITWGLFGNKMLDVIPLSRSTLLSQMNDAVITLDPDGLILDCNNAADQISVLKMSEHVGENLTVLLKEELGIDFDSGLTIDNTMDVIIGEGASARIYDMRVSHLTSGDQKVVGSLVVFRDITLRKQEETDRIQFEQRYQAIFQSSSYGILLVDHAGMIIDCNEQAVKLFGYSHNQVLFRSVCDLLKGTPEMDGSAPGTASFPPQEASLLQASGEHVPVELNITPICADEGTQYFVMFQDIRERKRDEITIRSTLDNLQSRMEEIGLLRSVTEDLNQASTLRAAILPVLETVTAITKTQHVWIYLLGKSDQAFQRIEYHPLDEGNQLEVENRQGGYPKCLEKLSEGKVEVPRVILNCVCCSLTSKSDHYTIPLYIGKQPMGVLNITDDEGVQNNENKIKLLQTICNSLAVAIERVRLFRTEHDQRKLAETMRDISTTLTTSLDPVKVFDLLLDQLSRMVPYDGANLMLVEESTARVLRLRGYELLGKGATETFPKMSFDIETTDNINSIVQNRKPLIIADTGKEPKWVPTKISGHYHSWLGAPVIVDGKVEAIFSLDKVEPGFYTLEHAKLVADYATQASLAIKNSRLFEAETIRIKELNALQATLTSINSQLEVKVLLREIVDRAIDLLAASHCEIGLYEPENNALRILVSRNLATDSVGRLIGMGEGVMGVVAETKKPFAINNYQEWAGRMTQYEDTELVSGLAVPMLGGAGELLGVLGVGSKEDRSFTENDIRLLNLFAQQATVALGNARLFENAKRMAEEAETIRKAGAVVVSNLNQEKTIDLILEQLALVVPYDSASVLLHQKSVLRLVGGHGFKDIEPLLGLEITLDRKNPGAVVFMDNQPRYLKNIPEETPEFNQMIKNEAAIYSWLGVPLTIQNKPIGILSLDSHTPNKFNEEHARLVTAFADQVAIALENSQLYEKAIQSAAQFETLYKLSQIVTATIRPEEIYPAIHQATMELMTTEFFSISLINEKEGLLEDVYMIDRLSPVELEKRPVTNGLFGKVIAEGKSRLYNTFSMDQVNTTGAVLIGDLEHEEISQSLLIVPLKIGARPIGILSAQSYQPYAYSDKDLEMLELLAGQVAISLENARLFGEVQELAITDSLTGIFNRRKFMEMAEQEFSRSRRYNRPLCVIMLDIDRFKQFNDTFGHSIGDQVLIHLAKFSGERLRQVDVIARYGGEEFMILLPETETQEAMVIAERIRHDSARVPVTTSMGELSFTISLGVAGLDESCIDLKELLDRVDFAMYASKDAGRNKVTLWSPLIAPRSKETGELRNVT